MSNEEAGSSGIESVAKQPSETHGIDPRYECPICLSCLKDPVLTLCGHKFCNTCIFSWLEVKEGCPMECGKLDKTKDLFPDRSTQREIMSERTICGTCSKEVVISNLEEHLQTHSIESQCPLKSIGCLMKVSHEGVAEHLQLQVNHHISLLGSKVDEIMRNSKIMLQEPMFWEPTEKQKKQDESQLATHLKSLFERLVVLEQHSREQEAHIQRLKNELSMSQSNYHELHLRHCHGQHVWQLWQFSEKLREMQSAQRKLFYSEGFYTSPTGYKVCARINLSPDSEDHLAFYIHLMKSPHDVALDWPFTGRINMSVIHPHNPELTVKETLMSRPDLDSFKRPEREINPRAFGYSQFISINHIFAKGFLVNDSLIVKIGIVCV